MKRLMVRYRVYADRAEENENYIRNVFEQLKAEAPQGIRYASFKLNDGVSFVHIASIETNDESNPLADLSNFKKFAADIKERCEELPVAEDLNEVGSYRIFD